MEQFFDYEMEHGLTPVEGYAWAGVPYLSGDPGAAQYRGWSAHGVDLVEPHVVGEDGYAYLRLWEMTGEGKVKVVLVLKVGELRRIRTGWDGVTARVQFEVGRGEGLRFDNVGWTRP